MTTYWQLLRDPRWQRKRLEIMERDFFKCRECHSGEKTLNVHHLYYEKGKSPWEYPNESLRTLCDDCHLSAELIRQKLLVVIGNLMFHRQEVILGFAKGLTLKQEEDDCCFAGSVDLHSNLEQLGALYAFGSGDHRHHLALMDGRPSLAEDTRHSLHELRIAANKTEEECVVYEQQMVAEYEESL